MASGTVTEAYKNGQKVRVTVAVDEGLAGIVPYSAEVPIADLKALATPTARRQALLAAVVAVRDAQLQEESAIDAFLANIIGATVTV